VSNFAQFHQACSPKHPSARGLPVLIFMEGASFGSLGKGHRPRNAAYGLAQTGSSNVGTVFASVQWRRTVTAHLKPAELEAITPIVEQKVVNLALQGGGSHGAFTWGVLDRLLEDGRLAFDGITATSAGAVNAVVLADGLALGGRQGARNALKNFWQKMSQMASSSIIAPSFFDQMNPKFGLEHTPA
jgi:hypothetical protein